MAGIQVAARPVAGLRRAERRSPRGAQGILARLGQLTAWIVIAAVALAVTVAVLIPRIAGAVPYTVLTGSMRPGLPPGTLVVVKPVDPAEIGVGSVITYQIASGEPEVVTHRVIAVGQDADGSPRWQTQGDANSAPDNDWVRPVQVKGALWYHVPHLGRAGLLLDADQRRTLAIAIAIMLLGYALAQWAGAVRERSAPRGGRRAGPRASWRPARSSSRQAVQPAGARRAVRRHR